MCIRDNSSASGYGRGPAWRTAARSVAWASVYDPDISPEPPLIAPAIYGADCTSPSTTIAKYSPMCAPDQVANLLDMVSEKPNKIFQEPGLIVSETAWILLSSRSAPVNCAGRAGSIDSPRAGTALGPAASEVP